MTLLLFVVYARDYRFRLFPFYAIYTKRFVEPKNTEFRAVEGERESLNLRSEFRLLVQFFCILCDVNDGG